MPFSFTRARDVQLTSKNLNSTPPKRGTLMNDEAVIEMENTPDPLAPLLDARNGLSGKTPRWQVPARATKFLGNSSVARDSWKPITLQAPVLGGFIITSLSIIVILEILYHKSVEDGDMNGGGVAFAADLDDLSTLSTFGYLYAPTILAVFYSMLWSWVDLDVKRLEPWFQLSSDSGSTAENSVLLQYPFDFLPFIPVTALRRRHWAVFLAGTVMLFIFWVVTPLQSSIFNTGTVTRSLSTNMVTSAVLSPISSQQTDLNVNFLILGYSIAWLGQSVPPFTSEDVAILPFQPVDTLPSSPATETWSTSTDIYSTDLDCTPAEFQHEPNGYTFSNGRGCSVPEINPLATNEYVILYISYYDNSIEDWFLQNPNCSEEHSNNFLALFTTKSSKLEDGSYSNLTALFCQPSYQVSEAFVTVNASNGMITNNGLGPLNPSSTSLGGIFNTSHFEYLLGVGVQPDGERADYPDITVIDQTQQLLPYNVTYPVTDMVGFAVSLNSNSLADLAAPDLLQQAFARAHKVLFSAAASTLMMTPNATAFENVRRGTRRDTVSAIIMVRGISIAVEVALILIVIMTASLWWVSHRRPSRLVRDPASITEVMSMVDRNSILHDLKYDESLTTEILSKSLVSQRFRIEVVGTDGAQRVLLGSNEPTVKRQALDTSSSPAHAAGLSDTPVRPIELRLRFGLVFISVIILALIVIVFLDLRSKRLNGLTLPSTNPLVLSLLENYVPTIFSTILEPTWVILNRMLCLLLPFEALRKGNTKSISSIKAKYTSLPPQFVIWRALRSRHYILAAVCLVAVSTNVLAVALSGLLVQESAIIQLTATTFQRFLPIFSGNSIQVSAVGDPAYFPHFYIAMSNLTRNTPLPPWVDRNYYYLPFEIPTLPVTTGSGTPLLLQGIQGSTTGFGAQLSCFEIVLNQNGSNTVIFEPSGDGSSVQFTTSHQLDNVTRVTCDGYPISNPFSQQELGVNTSTTSSSAIEIINNMQTPNSTDDEIFCSTLIVAGWVRVNPETSTERVGNATVLGGTLNSTFIGCKPQLTAATFDVFVDPDGRILEASQTGSLSQNSAQYFHNIYNISNETFAQEANNLIIPAGDHAFYWHNDSFTADWINSLIGYTIHSNAFVNPLAPVPDPQKATALLQGVYSQLFALLLGLNAKVFTSAPEPVPMTLTVITQETRLFLSSLMFTMSIVLLSLQLIVAVLYYTYRPKPFLPRMPTSIASIVAYVAASRALDDFSVPDSNGAERKDLRYGYGRFLGTDGKPHVGIERQRYVIPLETQNPNVRRRKWDWRSRKDDPKEPRTWI